MMFIVYDIADGEITGAGYTEDNVGLLSEIARGEPKVVTDRYYSNNEWRVDLATKLPVRSLKLRIASGIYPIIVGNL